MLFPNPCGNGRAIMLHIPPGGHCPVVCSELCSLTGREAKKNNREVMLSASSLFLWVHLTESELGKIPRNFGVLGAVSCLCMAARCAFIGLNQLSHSSAPHGCLWGSMGVTQPELPGCAWTYTPLYLFIASVFSSESYSL